MAAAGLTTAPSGLSAEALAAWWPQVQAQALALGFSQIGVAEVDLATAEPGLQAWLAAGFHGGMGYMAAHGLKRARPAELVPGTLRVITARMDYLPRSLPGDSRGDSRGESPGGRSRDMPGEPGDVSGDVPGDVPNGLSSDVPNDMPNAKPGVSVEGWQAVAFSRLADPRRGAV